MDDAHQQACDTYRRLIFGVATPEQIRIAAKHVLNTAPDQDMRDAALRQLGFDQKFIEAMGNTGHRRSAYGRFIPVPA